MSNAFRSMKLAAVPYLAPGAVTAMLRSELADTLTSIIGLLRLGEQLGVSGAGEAHAVRLEAARARLLKTNLMTPSFVAGLADDFEIVARYLRTLALAKPFDHAPRILEEVAAEFRKATA